MNLQTEGEVQGNAMSYLFSPRVVRSPLGNISKAQPKRSLNQTPRSVGLVEYGTCLRGEGAGTAVLRCPFRAIGPLF